MFPWAMPMQVFNPRKQDNPDLHLPHLGKLTAAIGCPVAESAFAPAGGVLCEATESGGWGLAHTVQPKAAKKDWWIHGVSKYVPSEAPAPAELVT